LQTSAPYLQGTAKQTRGKEGRLIKGMLQRDQGGKAAEAVGGFACVCICVQLGMLVCVHVYLSVWLQEERHW